MPVTRVVAAQQRAWFVTIPLTLMACGFLFVAGHTDDFAVSPLFKMAIFFALFLAAESTNVQIEVRRHGIQMSVTEIPLLLALHYLSPISVFAVRIAATII